MDQVVVSLAKEDDPSSNKRLVGTNNSMLSILLMFFKKVPGYIYSMISFCIRLPLVLLKNTLFISCTAILSLAIFVLLSISILIIRLFQFIRHGDGYEKLVQLKTLIRGWLYLDVPVAVISMWCLFPFFKYVPKVKQVTIFDLSFTKWIVLISIILVLCLLSSYIYVLAHQLIKVRNWGSPEIAQALTEIIDSLIFWWAVHEVIKQVPSCRNHEILGLSTRKWIEVTVLVIIGYNLIFLCVQLTVSLLRKLCCGLHLVTNKATWQKFVIRYMHTKYLVYIVEGIKWSVCMILRSLLIMLVWILYIGSHLNMNGNKAKNIWEVGKWTSISLFIFSVLWFIKTVVLLAWDVHTIYDRFKPMILSRSEKLYYLSILCMNKHKTLEPEWVDISPGRKDSTVDLCCLLFSMSDPEITHKISIKKMEKIKKSLLFEEKTDPTIEEIQQAIQYFLVAKTALCKENYISHHILKNFGSATDNRETLEKIFAMKVCDDEGWNPRGPDVEDQVNKKDKQDGVCSVLRNALFTNGRSKYVYIRETIVNVLAWVDRRDKSRNPRGSDVTRAAPATASSTDGVSRFVGMLRAMEQSDKYTSEFSINNIQKWVERTHNQCMSLANTLSSAREVSNCLNEVISWLLVGATILMWLLLTGFATTKVLVLIASPLLAATFIFGESCKILFEGILFVYVVHPLDVGDLCIINNDDKLMEVRTIGIWTTTFTKVDKFGTQEVVTFPNSDLATKIIVNYKTQFDWSHRAEFNLGPVIKTTIKKQKEVIDFFDAHLNVESCTFLSSGPVMTISITEDSFKLVIRLKYRTENTEDWTFSECLWKKDQLQGDFHVFMHNVIRLFEAELGGVSQPLQKNCKLATARYSRKLVGICKYRLTTD